MNNLTNNTISSIVNKVTVFIDDNNTFSHRTTKNLIALNTAAILLYSLLALVILILILLAVVIISLNKKSKVESENKYTSFINLRKSKDSGQYRLSDSDNDESNRKKHRPPDHDDQTLSVFDLSEIKKIPIILASPSNQKT